MKNIFNKNKKVCTIISETPYSKNEKGEFVGLDPTVEEIDHLGSLFKQIYHFAPLYHNQTSKSFIKHQKSNIRIIPMTPIGDLKLFKSIFRKSSSIIFSSIPLYFCFK